MNISPYEYQALALNKLYNFHALSRVDWIIQKQSTLDSLNDSESRKKDRMKDERDNNTRDATNRDRKKNPKDFDPGKRAAAPNQNDDPELHRDETIRALNQARHDIWDVLNHVTESDEETARKGNDEVRRDRERRDKNQNRSLADQNQDRKVTPIVSRTATTKKDGIINAIDQQLKSRIHRLEDKKK